MAKRNRQKSNKQAEAQEVIQEAPEVVTMEQAEALMKADDVQVVSIPSDDEGGDETPIKIILKDEQPKRATADCENAAEESCSCRCRSKYHGKAHPKGWKDEEGCEPLNEVERKAAKKAALYSWRKAHPERVSKYMKEWRAARKAEEASAAEESVEEGLENSDEVSVEE